MTHHLFRDVHEKELRIRGRQKLWSNTLQSCSCCVARWRRERCRVTSRSRRVPGEASLRSLRTQVHHPLFRSGMSQFERRLEPIERQPFVLRHAVGTQVALGEVGTRAAAPGERGLAVPVRGLAIVLRPAESVLEAGSEVVLAIRVTSQSASRIPATRLHPAERETALSFPMQVAEVARRRPVTAFRRLDQQRVRTHFERRRIPHDSLSSVHPMISRLIA